MKDDDDPIIKNALQFAFPSFDAFIDGLSDDQLLELHNYLIKQKNSDRVMEYILSKIPTFTSIQDNVLMNDETNILNKAKKANPRKESNSQQIHGKANNKKQKVIPRDFLGKRIKNNRKQFP